jgi:hypothetical protein
MPYSETERLWRRGSATPRRLRFRISWPPAGELGADSANEIPGEVFVLEEINCDCGVESPRIIGHFRTKAEAQRAADDAVGFVLDTSRWSETQDEC